MSALQYTRPEKPEGFRSYPDNLQAYADHYDKYRTACDSDMTGAMRRSASDVIALRSLVDSLRAELAEAKAQRVPDCFMRLYEHAYGMSVGIDWNKGTAAGFHREPLMRAVEECKAMLAAAKEGKV